MRPSEKGEGWTDPGVTWACAAKLPELIWSSAVLIHNIVVVSFEFEAVEVIEVRTGNGVLLRQGGHTERSRELYTP